MGRERTLSSFFSLSAGGHGSTVGPEAIVTLFGREGTSVNQLYRVGPQ